MHPIIHVIAMSDHSSTPDDPHGTAIILIVTALIVAVCGVAIWLGHRQDKAVEWTDDGDN